jgi:uncharacterized protein (TIGR03435 family)
MPTLRKGLENRFELKANLEKQIKPAYVLSIADSVKAALLKRSALSHEETYDANHSSFSGKSVSLSKIAQWLEGYGIIRMPIIDDTKDSKLYDITLTYMPEKNGDLEEQLAKMGLQLKKEDRKIDILVFR